MTISMYKASVPIFVQFLTSTQCAAALSTTAGSSTTDRKICSINSGHWSERHLYPGDGLLYHQAPRMRLKWMRAGERLYIGQLPLSPS
jgi:hypothetical protein